MATLNRLGIIGLVHDHIWNYLAAAKDVQDLEIACVADSNPPLLRKIQKQLGLKGSALYADASTMLDNEKLDGCLVFTESCRHAEITELCARRGLHVMVEKPMALNVAHAERMMRAAKENNVRLMVNFPTQWNAELMGVFEAVQSGRIGRVWMTHFREGHKGPREIGCSEYFWKWLYDPEKNGGGALVDFCVYGASMTALLLGRPNRISAASGKLVKTDLAAEDNGVITAQYDEKRAIAVIEGTWTQVGQGNNMSIFGELGSIASTPFPPKEYYMSAASGGLEKILPAQLPPHEDKPIKYFAHRVRNDIPFHGLVNPENARIAQEMLEAGLRSIELRREVALG
ncbi:MAG: Gfo/Idh/MocA family oxidoreductase [Candidatus Sumerlaeota bacterium]|nr:Gfo/Idh/MocA family oxidoreductase [Candidatus Sumerlaeota bacterium]